MSKHNNINFDKGKEEVVEELGVFNQVKKDEWKNISSKDCGNIINKTLEGAENVLGGTKK